MEVWRFFRLMLPIMNRRELLDGASRYARLMNGAVRLDEVLRWRVTYLSEMLDILSKQLAEERPA